MPSLQIRDMPDDLYARYKQCCAAEDRSMAQQTLRLIKTYLAARGALDANGTNATEPEETGYRRPARTEACRIATPTATMSAPIASESHWEDSIYNPMADIIGREERIAKRKALFKRCDELKLGEAFRNMPSAVELIREDRDTDHGRSYSGMEAL